MTHKDDWSIKVLLNRYDKLLEIRTIKIIQGYHLQIGQ